MRAPELRRYSLDDRYRAAEGTVYLTGVQALVRVLCDQRRADERAGLRTGAFVSGYPGSPVGGLDKELAANRAVLDGLGVVHVPGVNEELAATSVMGSQLVSTNADARVLGVAGMWYGKAPGLDRAGDALKHGNYAGASSTGGVLVVAGDDPGCKSSTIPSASETALYELYMPVLFPGTPQEVLDLGLHGYAMSRASRLWTGFKIVANVADATMDVDVDPARLRLLAGDVVAPGSPNSFLLAPASLDIERELTGVRMDAALAYVRANGLNRVALRSPGAWLGIVAAGRTWYDLRQALRDLGLTDTDLERAGVRLLKVAVLHPLDRVLVREFARGLEEVLVLEDKRPFLERFVREALYGTPDQPLVVGKTDERDEPLVPVHGTVDADQLAGVVASRLRGLAAMRERPVPRSRVSLSVAPVRQPWFCSGCPHNRSTQVPEGTLVGGGIGCHSMVVWMDPRNVGEYIGLTQMGGEGAQWIGMAPFLDRPHIVQNIGDGTFFHSGSLAVRAAVASGVNVTYKLLYNAAIAMTGGQTPAGTMDVPSVTRLLEVEGVRRTIVTTEEPSRYDGAALARNTEVWHRDRLVEAQRVLSQVPGVTALVHDQQCAAEKRRHRKRGRLPKPTKVVVINERVCEGCGDCGLKSNCLSVEPVDTEFGRKTRIDQATCNADYSCLLGDCPSFVTVSVDADAVAPRRRRPSPPADMPEPARPAEATVRMVGIGGTGVVTISQLLGTAALLDGLRASGLDQTGLAQKGGAVVSDLHIGSSMDGAAKVSSGAADVLIAFDALTATVASNLAVTSPDRTVAIVSTARTATGQMITHPGEVSYPDDESLRAVIDGSTLASRNVWLDAQDLAERLTGTGSTANVLALGAAWQAGTLPVSAAALETAIELNDVAVESNLAAFRWGRAVVAAPERVPAASEHLQTTPSWVERRLEGFVGELRRLLAIRVADLAAYQSRRYAEQYLSFVATVARVDGAVAEAVARYLYKLMAYKDEYEVARLHLDAEFAASLPDGTATIMLHPPLLREAGWTRKIGFGPWARPVLRALVAGRRLRGTSVDPFGRTRVRRLERELVGEYRDAVSAALARLTPENRDDVVALASLPDLVRGYEGIKLRNAEIYRRELQDALARLGAS